MSIVENITPDIIKKLVFEHTHIDIGDLVYSDTDECKRYIFKYKNSLNLVLICKHDEGARLIYGPAQIVLTSLGTTVISYTALELYITYEEIKVISKRDEILNSYIQYQNIK
jgi:hypothetical protein